MKFHLTRKSSNRKTGKIPVSTSPESTCPERCPLKGQGCYADGGPLKIHWRQVSDGSRGLEWGQFLAEIEKLPESQLWRHNQAGDLVSSERQTDRIDLKHLVDLVKANTGKKGFTYTHYDVLEDGFTGDHNRNAIRNANTRGFTINLSADSFDEADKMVELGIAPVTVLLPSEVHGKTCTTPSGNKVITCPAAMKDNISCETCALCYRTKRPFIIGFPAHGAKKSTVDRFLSVLEEADAISNIGISAT